MKQKHYSFPIKKELVMKAWIKATGINNPNARICGFHFKPDDYWEGDRSERKRLKGNAVSSLLLPTLDDNVDKNAEPLNEVSCFFKSFGWWKF